jgi:hypothetical protein
MANDQKLDPRTKSYLVMHAIRVNGKLYNRGDVVELSGFKAAPFLKVKYIRQVNEAPKAE